MMYAAPFVVVCRSLTLSPPVGFSRARVLCCCTAASSSPLLSLFPSSCLSCPFLSLPFAYLPPPAPSLSVSRPAFFCASAVPFLRVGCTFFCASSAPFFARRPTFFCASACLFLRVVGCDAPFMSTRLRLLSRLVSSRKCSLFLCSLARRNEPTNQTNGKKTRNIIGTGIGHWQNRQMNKMALLNTTSTLLWWNEYAGWWREC